MNDKKYLNDLDNFLTILKKDKPKEKNITLELECRFEIDYQIVDIIKKLNQTQLFTIEEEKSTVEYHGDYGKYGKYRKIIYNFPKQKIVKEIKNQISYTKVNLQGYPINFSHSHEIETEFVDNKDPQIKNRQRYIIKNFLGPEYELHLTSAFDPFQNKQKNHVEIEYNIEKINKVPQFFIPIKYIFDLMYVKSEELLSPTYILPIIKDFNSKLGELKGKLNYNDKVNIKCNKLINYEDKPISIKQKNIIDVNSDKYFVTNKLNGTRYFLYITNSTFYLIGKTGSTISTIPTLVWKLLTVSKSKIPSDKTFILDGEYFDGLKNSKLYYAFDILVISDKNVTKKPYSYRIDSLRKTTQYISLFSPVEMKFIKHGNSCKEVIKFMKDTFSDEWDIDNDGLIYTSVDSLYANKEYAPLKWKFAHHQSVDVLVKIIPDKPNYYECHVTIPDENVGKIKTPEDKHNAQNKPKTEKFTEYLLYSPIKLLNNSIVEVSFDKNKMEFYMMRLRPDKEAPNFITVAESFWIDIISQIPIESLTSKILSVKNKKEDWKNYRQDCANPSKENLIKTINSKDIVIDIGFGKGGDVLKYAKQGINFIIGVEPDYENIQNFFERFNIEIGADETYENKVFDKTIVVEEKVRGGGIKKYPLIRFVIVNKSAVDPVIVEIIIDILKENERNITVCMFFSLTYFFNPQDDFVKLVYIISHFFPSRILGSVMDGKSAKNLINDYIWNSSECGLELKLFENNKVFISIEKSATVSGHYEYLCDLNRFENYLKLYNFKLDRKKYLNFNNGENNLLTHFASTNCIFDFKLTEKIDIVEMKNKNDINKMCIAFNLKFGLELDSLYFYNCFIAQGGDIIEKIKNFFNTRLISQYKIEKQIEFVKETEYMREIKIVKEIDIDKTEIEVEKEIVVEKEIKLEKQFLTFNGSKIDNYEVDYIRYLLLTNKYNKDYRFVYKFPLINEEKYKHVVETLFDKDKLNFELSNVYYEYYLNNENNSYEIFDFILKHLSPVNKYNIIEYNSGIGNLTIEFAKMFKKVCAFDDNSNILKMCTNNFYEYYDIKPEARDKKIDNTILNINGVRKEIAFRCERYNLSENIKYINEVEPYIIFVNYQFNNIPTLFDLSESNVKFIAILTPNTLDDISLYYSEFYIYKLKNNYLYFIKK